MENKSYRGMLIEVLIKSFSESYLFDVSTNLQENLQELLYLNLRFETEVSIETKNEQTLGKVCFEDENGLIKVVDFTIVPTMVDNV